MENFTVFIGRNDSGKSAVLDALAMFFNEYTPDSDDASLSGNKADMAVICEFGDLPRELVIDADYRINPTEEWLLNERGLLEIHRIFNGAIQKPKLTRTFLVARHPISDNLTDLLYLKNSELKTRARDLGVELEGVDQRINSSLRQAIWRSAGDFEVAQREIDIEKEDAKKIWTVLNKQLPVFALFHSDRKSTDQDDEAQDPLKTAINEALQTQEDALETLTGFVKEQVLGIARATVEKLREMDPGLAQELNPRFKKPEWAKVFGVSLTDDAQIPINKRGSGVRRLVLLNFFRAKAEKQLFAADASGIIYAIEEPETSQHPRNQKILLSALRELSEQPGCQVVITTHTPVLVRDLPLDTVRYVTVTADGMRSVQQGERIYHNIAQELGVIPDHDVRLFIGVEGVNDIDFLCNLSEILRAAGENFLDLRALESQGKIIFIPVGGSNLVLWTHRLAGLNRPEFHLYDRDDQPPVRSHNQEAVDAINARGCVAILTEKREMENYIHTAAIQSALAVNIVFGNFDDVPELVAQELHRTTGGPTPWNSLDEKKRRQKVSQAKRRLNSQATRAMTPALLTQLDTLDEVRTWLREISRLYNS